MKTPEQKVTEALRAVLADGVSHKQIFDALKELWGPTVSMDVWTKEDFEGVLEETLTDEQAGRIAADLLTNDYIYDVVRDGIHTVWGKMCNEKDDQPQEDQ